MSRPMDVEDADSAAAVVLLGPDAVRQRLPDGEPARRLLMMIDQFEEAFVVVPAELRARFLGAIADLVESMVAATVVITMRDEFFGIFVAEAPRLARALEDGLRTVPMLLSRRDLSRVVAGPAERVGLQFEDGLVDRIVDDAVAAVPAAERDFAASTVLPLLELALTRLWEAAGDSAVLTHRDYEAVGRVTGGLADWAEQAMTRFDDDALPLVRRVLVGLVHLGDDTLGVAAACDTPLPQHAYRRLPRFRIRIEPALAGDAVVGCEELPAPGQYRDNRNDG